MSEKPRLDQLIEQASLALMRGEGNNRQWSLLAGIVLEELINRGIIHVAILNVEPGMREKFPIARVYANFSGVCLEVDQSVLTMLPSQIESIKQAARTPAVEQTSKAVLRSNKLKELAELEEFLDTQELLEECSHDSIVPGICLEPGCSYTTDVEPDQANGWCEKCQKRTVASCMVLAGII